MPKITIPENGRYFGKDADGKHRFFEPGEKVEVSKTTADKIGSIAAGEDQPEKPVVDAKAAAKAAREAAKAK